MVTFEEWQATRQWCDDLSKCEHDWPIECSGFMYQPAGVIEAHGGGAAPARYVVTVYKSEWVFDTLEDAETKLWNEFVRDEIVEALDAL